MHPRHVTASTLAILVAAGGFAAVSDLRRAAAEDTARPDAAAVHAGAICGGPAAVSDAELLDAAAAAARAGAPSAQGTPPLYDGLGAIGRKVSTDSEAAQRYFDQGLALAWGFNHGEAIRSFRAAEALDPACAMCAWGEAYAHGANINAPMAPEALAPAQAAIARAVAAKDGASAVEWGLIDALALRYDPAEPDAAAREAAWADALGALAKAHPDDADVHALFAEALMNLQPWDYWEADKATPKGRAAEIVAALERALEIDPDHAGAMHFHIHAVEASSTPERAEPHADRLRGAAPALGHLVHMPGHIYLRVGRYEDLLEVNRDAVAADEALIAQMGDAATPLYAYGYFPHNIHFMLISAQMIGAGEDAVAAAEKLASAMSDEVAADFAFVQAMKTAVYAMHSLYSPPETVLALPEPDAAFPYVRGFRHYARGLAHAAQGDLDAARAEADAIAEIASGADMSVLEAQALPAPLVLGLAERVVRARVASAEGDPARAEALLREAAEMQDAIPYMEPPYWHYPVRQTLAAVLLAQGRAEEAVAMFERALEEQPNNAWTLAGLAAARRAAGDAAGAEAAEAGVGAVWRGDPALLAVERL